MSGEWLLLAGSVALLGLVGAAVLMLPMLHCAMIMVTFFTPIPYIPSRRGTIHAIAASDILKGRRRVADLGCGSGTMLNILARKHPETEFIGIEHLRILVWMCRARFLGWSHPPKVHLGDMFTYSLKGVDAVVGFWIPAVLPDILRRLVEECEPGCVVISNLFPLPVDPNFRRIPHDFDDQEIYVYERVTSVFPPVKVAETPQLTLPV